MSNTKRQPLKEQDILDVCERYADNYPCEGRITVNSMAMRRAVEPLVEAARAKDAELIQQLFDALYAEQFVPSLGPSPLTKPSLAAAAAAGFKPTEQ